MGNNNSSLLNTRRAEPSNDARVSVPNNSDRSSGNRGRRERDTSSSHSPRKRNRFSLLRNPFRSTHENATRSTATHDRRRQRSDSASARIGRSHEPVLMEPQSRGESVTPQPDPSFVDAGGAQTESMPVAEANSFDIVPNRDAETLGVERTLSHTEADDYVRASTSDFAHDPEQDRQDASSPHVSLHEPVDLASTSQETSEEGVDTQSSRRGAGLPADEQAGILAQLLSAAATATANSLIGSTEMDAIRREGSMSSNPGVDAARADSGSRVQNSQVIPDSVDGTFGGFLNALQNGRLAQALRGGNQSTESMNTSTEESLNFFRIFRFGTTSASEDNATNNDGAARVRMVPIIIVGIRSVRPGITHGQGESFPPIFGALQNMGRPGSAERPLQDTSALADRPSVDRPAPAAHPSASIPISTNAQLPETQESPSDRALTRSESHAEDLQVNDTATDDRSPSAAIDSDAQHAPSILDTVRERLRSFRPEQTSAADTTRRRSRRPTWRPFSSSDSRGLQDSTDRDPAARQNSATFLVYVLGGTYPENHPILTTPSLFTDSPSYEDMMMLTSLLGPAAPQTADGQDLDSAGLSYELPEHADELEARCQVCLSSYEVGNSCRRLAKCGHLFHKECIDEWLTTGRNNCPMCRADTAARMKAPEAPSGARDMADPSSDLASSLNEPAVVTP